MLVRFSKDIALDILPKYYIAYGDSFLRMIDARYLCDRIAIQKGKQGGSLPSLHPGIMKFSETQARRCFSIKEGQYRCSISSSDYIRVALMGNLDECIENALLQ